MSGSIRFDHEGYLSPFTWRYGSEEMRSQWSEHERRRIWRRIWVALAEAQASVGLVRPEQVEDLRAHQDEIDLGRAEEIEREIHHDLMAEVRCFAEQCPLGGGIIHLGATSMDVVDNADVLRVDRGLELLLERLRELLLAWAERIDQWADQPTLGWTHLQPAEPTTMGYRLALYGLDLLTDLKELEAVRNGLRAKGIKGAVGTSASYAELLKGTGLAAEELETRVMDSLGLRPAVATGQTYPRKQDYRVVSALASLGQSLYRFAQDLRLLQSPPFGEWAEPFGSRQVGSSAMPFKRNPIQAENLCSLARQLAALPRTAWDNAAHSMLERTLDDSANRRSLLPESFLLADEILRRGFRLIRGLRVDPAAAGRHLSTYGVFAATERLLMELVRHGADRQEMHEVIRRRCLEAWEALQRQEPNPLMELLAEDPEVRRHLESAEIRDLLDAGGHLGDAPARARRVAQAIRSEAGREGEPC